MGPVAPVVAPTLISVSVSRGLSCVLVSPFLGFVGGTVFGTAQPFSCEIFEHQYTKPCFLQDFDFPLLSLFVSTPIHCFGTFGNTHDYTLNGESLLDGPEQSVRKGGQKV